MKNLKKVIICLLTILLAACGNETTTATEQAAETDTEKTIYTSTGDNEHAIEVDGEEATYENISVSKTGDGEGDEADFYGENAAVYATNGANVTITNATVTTAGNYANGVFSYGEGTVITISDSTITTSERNSGGIMVTGGGTLYANNLNIETEGGSSAAIRSDRGGGTLVVDGGSYVANGSGSPAIYSTADILVNNATLTSGSAQGVVVEGGNNVELTNCDLTANNMTQNSDKSEYYQAVMLYQSMSGDASGGAGSFKMTGGSLISLNGGMFFVTNATYTIDLSDVDLTYASDDLLRISAAGWGNDGSNGGQVNFNLNNQEVEGVITVDSISKLNMYLSNGSDFTGTFENEGEVYVEIEDESTWTLTADCSISSLTCAEDCIDLNGYTLTVNGTKYVEGSKSEGAAIEFTVSELSGMPEMSGDRPEESGGEMPQEGEFKPEDGEIPPEKPDGEKNDDSEIPPEKPDGEQALDGDTPPEKPDEKK